jgi:type II secretory pathway pseudopilin PulG
MKNRGGFTIVETIITLAVSSVLFVTVMLMFSGRQGKIQFSQGLRDIEAYIMDVANDVQDGYFPKLTSLTCDATNPGAPAIVAQANAKDQGTNNGCIFAGKVLYFDGANSQSIRTYSMAGRSDAKSLATLYPAILSATDISGNVKDTSEIYQLPAGIMLVDDTATSTASAIAFFFDVSVASASSGGVSNVIPYGLTMLNNNIDGLSSGIKNAFTGVPPSTKDLKTLCFKSGTSSQYGTISITKGLNGLTTTTLISVDKGTACAVQ